MSINIGVYVLYSSDMTPQQIRSFLEKFKTKDSVIGPIRVEFSKSKETNRNICLISSDVYFNMKKEGHNTKERKDGISICNYHLNHRDFPPGRWAPMDIFVKLPYHRTADLCREILENKLKAIGETGFFSGDYKIDIPLKKRSTAEHHGRAIIYFDGVDRPKLALIKVMITNSLWGSKVDKYNKLRVFTNWFKNKKEEELKQKEEKGEEVEEKGEEVEEKGEEVEEKGEEKVEDKDEAVEDKEKVDEEEEVEEEVEEEDEVEEEKVDENEVEGSKVTYKSKVVKPKSEEPEDKKENGSSLKFAIKKL